MFVLGVCLFGLWGCATSEPVRPRPTPRVATPPQKPSGLEELLVTQVEEKRGLEERLISFSVQGVDVKEVLRGLAEASELNIVYDPDISGPVTVDLKDVTLAETLDLILTPLGLEYRREKNVLRVTKPQLETRIFTIDYVNIKRGGTSAMDVSATAAVSGAAVGSTAGGGGGLEGGTARVESKGTDIDLLTDLEKELKPLLSPQGALTVNKLSGTIAVTDFPKNQRRVAAFLEQVTGRMMRQVIINARVLEVVLTDDYQFGIDWTAVATYMGTQGTFTQVLSPNAGFFQISVTDSDFSAVLDAVATQGDVNTLSNPKVAALNNQKAIIRAARDDVFFVTSVRTIDQGGTTIERVTETIPQTVSIGVILDVTPQIGSDGTVTMHIHPIVTDNVGTATAVTGETAPIVAIRETDTMVTVQDGQTIIIGGLIEERQDDSIIKVPLLGDIPLLGGLFRQTKKKGRKAELVILLSPTVLIGDRAQQTTAEALERVEKMKREIPYWPLPKKSR
jgi:MSHA biogenesis protein MshL